MFHENVPVVCGGPFCAKLMPAGMLTPVIDARFWPSGSENVIPIGYDHDEVPALWAGGFVMSPLAVGARFTTVRSHVSWSVLHPSETSSVTEESLYPQSVAAGASVYVPDANEIPLCDGDEENENVVPGSGSE
jgi:hypothetical protein